MQFLFRQVIINYYLSIEYAQAVDFVERALFTYERAFVGAFTLTSGINRLDFDHVENRPFFLALHRQITYVSYVCSSDIHRTLFSDLGICNVVAAYEPPLNSRGCYILWILGRIHMVLYCI